MSRGWRIVVGTVVGLAVAVVAVSGYLGLRAWRSMHEPFKDYPGAAKVIDVPRGIGAGEILRNLEAEGIIANADLARLYLIYKLEDPFLKAGEYRFEGALPTPEVLAKLISGDVVTYPVTIIEGLTLMQTTQRLGATDFGEPEEFEQLVRSPSRILDLDPEATDLEGYLFPETYHFARGTSAEEIIDTMLSTFRQRYQGQVAPLLDPESELTIRDIVTLASIVETEAQLDEERSIIAGVYANRLRIGMPLQADPTVIYSLTLAGNYDGNLRRDDLKFDSPYNTYVYRGLPPGPIASPGLASLQAAARPADVPYLYFVSRNDGSHVFAKTLREHNRNVNEWQKVYWRKKWAEERRQKAAQNPSN